MWKAFDEMEEDGPDHRTDRPRMVSVQAEGCAPMVKGVRGRGRDAGRRFRRSPPVASGLRVPKAIGDFMMLNIFARAKARPSP